MATLPSSTMGFRWFWTCCPSSVSMKPVSAEVLRNVHPRRALPLDLLAALLDDAGVQQ